MRVRVAEGKVAGVQRLAKSIARLLLVGAAVVSLTWVALVVFIWRTQESLLFFPTQLPPDAVLSTDPQVHERWVDVDGARLSLLQMQLPDPDGVVFFLHGNGGSLQNWFVDPSLYRQANFDLVMLDYRGYGKSSGQIESEAQLHNDVLQVWEHIAPQYRDMPVVIYGRSLGTGLAARLATTVQPELTVLVSPYVSMRELAAHYYPWLPGAVLRYPMRTDQWLGHIDGPVLIFHGSKDSLIPPRHAQDLAALSARARLVLLDGAAHDDVHVFDEYRNTLKESLRSLVQSN